MAKPVLTDFLYLVGTGRELVLPIDNNRVFLQCSSRNLIIIIIIIIMKMYIVQKYTEK